MKGTFPLGEVVGIKIYLHWTFFLLVVYVFGSEVLRGGTLLSGSLLLLLMLAVFGTVVLHEFGHSLMAKRFGFVTRDIVLLPIGGIARMERLPEVPIQEILVAVAGPAVNALLAALSWFFFIRNSTPFDLKSLGTLTSDTWMAHFFFANVVLVVFNLIPAFPMDGGRVFRGLLAIRLDRDKATRIAARTGQLIALGFIALGFYANPFLVFIGLFIIFSAEMEVEYFTSKSMLFGSSVRDVIMSPLPTIDFQATLRDAMNSLLSGQEVRFIVVRDLQPVGTIDRKRILDGIEKATDEAPVVDWMQAGVQGVGEESDLGEVLRKMQSEGQPLMLVTESGTVKGYVDLENILEFMLFRKALTKKKRFQVNP